MEMSEVTQWSLRATNAPLERGYVYLTMPARTPHSQVSVGAQRRHRNKDRGGTNESEERNSPLLSF